MCVCIYMYIFSYSCELIEKFSMLLRVSCSLNSYQAYILFTFIYWFSKNQKQKLSKILTNTPVKIFYQRNAKTTNLYCPS